MSSEHTYGPTCHLSPNAPASEDGMPSMKAQFFYTSPLPIDDPLSAVPPASSSETTKHPPRPFSAFDNNALEEAWLAGNDGENTMEVPVGISRLHSVKLQPLLMIPIYWSPVHDIAAVTRGTWFYRDNLYPVEPAVANRLELGYRELRPWSRTWKDELNSAIEVGAIGEEKISHPIWPVEEAKGKQVESTFLSTDPGYAAKHFYNEAAAEGSLESGSRPSSAKASSRKYATSHVIYKDARNAFILKPTLQPSAYFGRKPLQKIIKGMTIGIHVVRGFDWRAWEKIHPSKRSRTISKTEEMAPQAGTANAPKSNFCKACGLQEERPRVKELILVIHGIGQKLSERVESFHFTHAINSFRRSVNVELGNKSLDNVLDLEGGGGIMVLPVNWRSTLSFEDGGPMKDGDQDHGDFTLKDITPETIPAVRNILADVMLDIPYYLSHHKPKMINAVITEANRVYRLWCKNNPGFHETGRVHLIAHSLGSAMAMEVLSTQPTSVKYNEDNINFDHFDFNTTNLFFAGSPAGFFLLLNKANLIPRRGQNKPGTDFSDDGDSTGEEGTFGCLAVDNVYNILAANDPIAYRLNATVDSLYTASLKLAKVPSATVSFFAGIGNALKTATPGLAATPELAIGHVAKPTIGARLPSQVEMAVHDFTREELAEKRFYLLNDNGQIDWYLSTGGGPLEIQYINMLGAHSSYWTSPDFVRMIVIEVGRKPGRANTLPNMRAVKKPGHK
ncbi:DDHD domain-containing protein [Bisporella sp. PMI_857]|nr:DDHD domain-containing protein [Bisporella sp. PMI_857]